MLPFSLPTFFLLALTSQCKAAKETGNDADTCEKMESLIKGLSEEQRADFPNFAEVLATAEAECDAAAAAKRAANPLKKQFEQADRWHKKQVGHQADANAALAAAREALDKAQADVAARQKAVTEAGAAVAKALAERATLAAQLAAEKGATAELFAATPAAAVVECETVSIAHAEKLWVEREQQFAAERAALLKHFEDLQAATERAAKEGAEAAENASADGASDATLSDLGSVADLEQDAAWAAVDKGRRRAVLARAKHGTALMRELRAISGSRPKCAVSSAASPFQKRAKA